MPLQKISTTNAFASLPDKACTQVTIRNKTTHSLDVRYASDTDVASINTLDDGDVITLPVIDSAAELEIKAASTYAGVNLVYES